MALLQPFTKVFFLLVLFALLLVLPSSSLKPTTQLVGRRNLLEKNHVQEYSDGIQPSTKKKQSTTTIALGTTTLSKNMTKLIKPTTSNSTKTLKLPEKTSLKKLNSTSKPSNLTKPTSKTTTLPSKSTNSTKPTSKTPSLSSKTTNSTKPTSKTPSLSSKSTKSTKPTSKTQSLSSKTTNSTKPTSKSSNNTKPTSKTTNPTKPTSTLTQKSKDPTINKKSTKGLTLAQNEQQQEEQEEEDDDLITEFKDLPSRFQETLIPDLELISTTSKTYLNNANKHITKHFKPLVGKKYAPMVASLASFIFILIPFLLMSLIFNKIKAYFSLQKIIIFIQIYLSIYFSILSLSSLVTGLEPLKFFYNTSQSTYVCMQLLQTVCYVMYLVLVLMYFVVVFSTDVGVGLRLLGFGQMFVGFAVGLHYYMMVFHRAVLRLPPKTSWKVHSVYATCFLVICLLATAERRKKAYVVDGCEEEKKN